MTMTMIIDDSLVDNNYCKSHFYFSLKCNFVFTHYAVIFKNEALMQYFESIMRLGSFLTYILLSL